MDHFKDTAFKNYIFEDKLFNDNCTPMYTSKDMWTYLCDARFWKDSRGNFWRSHIPEQIESSTAFGHCNNLNMLNIENDGTKSAKITIGKSTCKKLQSNLEDSNSVSFAKQEKSEKKKKSKNCRFRSMSCVTETNIYKRRQNQIRIIKSSKLYKTYLKANRDNPEKVLTPKKNQQCSRNEWDKAIKLWRRELYKASQKLKGRCNLSETVTSQNIKIRNNVKNADVEQSKNFRPGSEKNNFVRQKNLIVIKCKDDQPKTVYTKTTTSKCKDNASKNNQIKLSDNPAADETVLLKTVFQNNNRSRKASINIGKVKNDASKNSRGIICEKLYGMSYVDVLHEKFLNSYRQVENRIKIFDNFTVRVKNNENAFTDLVDILSENSDSDRPDVTEETNEICGKSLSKLVISKNIHVGGPEISTEESENCGSALTELHDITEEFFDCPEIPSILNGHCKKTQAPANENSGKTFAQIPKACNEKTFTDLVSISENNNVDCGIENCESVYSESFEVSGNTKLHSPKIFLEASKRCEKKFTELDIAKDLNAVCSDATLNTDKCKEKQTVVSASIDNSSYKNKLQPHSTQRKRKRTRRRKFQVHGEILKKRQEQIDFTRSTAKYKAYLRAIPKHKRIKGVHPTTPQKHTKLNKQPWDSQIEQWRSALEKWVPISDKVPSNAIMKPSCVGSNSNELKKQLNEQRNSVKSNSYNSFINVKTKRKRNRQSIHFRRLWDRNSEILQKRCNVTHDECAAASPLFSYNYNFENCFQGKYSAYSDLSLPTRNLECCTSSGELFQRNFDGCNAPAPSIRNGRHYESNDNVFQRYDNAYRISWPQVENSENCGLNNNWYGDDDYLKNEVQLCPQRDALIGRDPYYNFVWQCQENYNMHYSTYNRNLNNTNQHISLYPCKNLLGGMASTTVRPSLTECLPQGYNYADSRYNWHGSNFENNFQGKQWHVKNDYINFSRNDIGRQNNGLIYQNCIKISNVKKNKKRKRPNFKKNSAFGKEAADNYEIVDCWPENSPPKTSARLKDEISEIGKEPDIDNKNRKEQLQKTETAELQNSKRFWRDRDVGPTCNSDTGYLKGGKVNVELRSKETKSLNPQFNANQKENGAGSIEEEDNFSDSSESDEDKRS